MNDNNNFEILQTPRGIRHPIGRSPSPSPRDNTMVSADMPVDFARFQKERFEAFTLAKGKITYDVNKILHSVCRNAMLCGKTHFRLQTLRMPGAFSYTYNRKDDDTTHTIYHIHTLKPIADTTARVKLNKEYTKPLFDWLREQGVHFYLTTHQMSNTTSFNNKPLANFVHIEAYLIPEDTDIREKTGMILSLWNGVYTIKCLDQSMIGEWNKRLLSAFRTGAAHCVICTLYLESDYEDTPKNNKNNLPIRNEYNVLNPRDHLTMELLNPMPDWSLKDKFTTLLSWVTQLNYKWTLLCSDKCSWAYFTVMLDPVEDVY